MMEDPEAGGLFDLGADPDPADIPGQTPLFAPTEVPEPDEPVTLVDLEADVAPVGGGLFGDDQSFHAVWREWQGMPEFSSDDMMPWYQIIVNFAEPEDLKSFGELVGVPLNATARRTTSMWWPPQMKFGPSAVDKRYRDPHDEQYWRRTPKHFRKDPNAEGVREYADKKGPA